MKTLFTILVLIALASCEKQSRKGMPYPETVQAKEVEEETTEVEAEEVSTEVPTEEEQEEVVVIEEEIVLQKYNLTKMEVVGIHLQNSSGLTEIGNPPVIYCSNTEFTNLNKIEALKDFRSFLEQDSIEVPYQIEVEMLQIMITNSIALLEKNPHSRFCPLIYLSL